MMMKRLVGKYQLGEVIGRGAYSQVFRCRHLDDKQLYAIKVINNKLLLENAKVKECITNQISTHSSIGHSEYIVRFKELLQTKNNCYFVYEFCEGGNLHEYLIKQGPLSQSAALIIFKQVLQAFQLLHKHNIMHRDVKPENILIKQNVFKLADFGFCKELKSESHMTKTMLGSPLYMAPQVLRGESYTSNADIWSLGVILYEMLVGRCPFESNSIANLISKIEETNLGFDELQVSQSTKSLIQKCLQKDQKNRLKWDSLFQIIEDKAQTINFHSQLFSKSTRPRPTLSALAQNNSSSEKAMGKLEPKSKYQIFKQNYNKSHDNANKQPLSLLNVPPSVNSLTPLSVTLKTSQAKIDVYDLTSVKNQSEIIMTDTGISQKERNRSLTTKQSEMAANCKCKEISKFGHIVENHEICVKILAFLLQKLENKEASNYKYFNSTLRKIRLVLEKIYSQINLNDTQMLPILSIIKYELIQIEKVQAETEKALGYSSDLQFSPAINHQLQQLTQAFSIS